MEPKVTVTMNVWVMPFGLYRTQEIIHLASPSEETQEPVILPVTTNVDHLISTPPVEVIRA